MYNGRKAKECAADRVQMRKELISWINDIWFGGGTHE